ncbi:MAG: methionine--tRNA ligase [Fimbriimonadaceae bacterium]|nr:methionine--tRNA ligase [Fimbriimonadaceae bacterium]
MSKKYYITTPIYYVNSAPHIGTALTTFVCDATRRYQTMRGEDAWFVTGTDENALKVMEAAEKSGKPTMEFVDEVSGKFVECWNDINIDYDDFIRTTEPRHIQAVQKFFDTLRENGFVYQDKYEGWYDVGSETFVREADLVDGKSPDGNEVRWVTEENWFFKLSAFEQKLLDHIETNEDFLLPSTRRNEVISFIKSGLRDMCITRKNPGWGIPVPGDPDKVIYVWFDALINYIAATGWPNPGWEDLWPCDVHWMGKEIYTRFHATLWPAMLMGVGLPLPKHVIAHGWFTFGGTKISKSKGNIIAPMELASHLVERSGCAKEAAVDGVRYSLAAFLPYEGDTNYTIEEVEGRFNYDLANDLGNALNRSLSMAHKFVDGVVPEAEIDPDVMEAVQLAKENYAVAMMEFRIDRTSQIALDLVRFLNKYIDSSAPWALAKNNDPRLGTVIRSMLFCLRSAEALFWPIMPTVSGMIAAQLGCQPDFNWDNIGNPDTLPAGTKLEQPQPIFPRIDLKKPIEAKQNSDQPSASGDQKKKMNNEKSESNDQESANPKSKIQNPKSEPTSAQDELITIDDFAKVKLRVARILEAEPLEGTDKLLKLQVVIGEEKRQVVAGIRKNYDPMDLIGRQVVIVYNLKPAKLRGTESQGMLLAATDEEGGAILLQPDKEAPEGTTVR